MARLKMMNDWGLTLPMPQRVAQMADEINGRKDEEWKPPFDEHEYQPEATVPDDWLLRESIAKDKAKQGLAEEPKADSTGYTIYIEESD